MPPACAKEKKIIKELREKLALRTPLGPRGTRIHGDTPRSTPRSRSVWAKPTPKSTTKRHFAPSPSTMTSRQGTGGMFLHSQTHQKTVEDEERANNAEECAQVVLLLVMILPLLGKE